MRLNHEKDMRIAILFVCLIFASVSFAQTKKSNVDLRFGVGTSLLGTGDMQTLMFENEVNVKLNRFIALGGGIAYAKSDNGVFETASFTQLNTNVYFSPFKNEKRNDFRVGTGLSWYAVSDAHLQFLYYTPNSDVVREEYEFDNRNSFGFNVLLENTYTLSDRYLIGLKAFTPALFQWRH